MANTVEGAKRAAATKLGIPFEEYRLHTDAGMKWCWRCRNWVLREQFSTDATRSDGLVAQCMPCRRVKSRMYRTAVGTPAERQGAHDAIRHAVKKGRMTKASALPCLDCGAKAAHYHHHHGYERQFWLDVVAVCVSCHQKRHWLEPEGALDGR